MAAVYEPAPSLYTRADAASLFSAASSEKLISDVDMAVEDAAAESQQQGPATAATASSSRWETEDAEDVGGPDGQEQQQQGNSVRAGATEVINGWWSPDGGPEDFKVQQQHVDVHYDVDRPAKRHKHTVYEPGAEDALDIDNEALLAGVNQALEQLDAEETAAAAGRDVGGAGGADADAGGVRGHRGAAEAAGPGTASSMSLGASLTSGNSKGGILKGGSTPGSVKKKVTWPDLPQEEEQQSGFRIATARRQVRDCRMMLRYVDTTS